MRLSKLHARRVGAHEDETGRRLELAVLLFGAAFLVCFGLASILIANRSMEKAERLAERVGGSVLAFADLPAFCRELVAHVDKV